MKRAALAGLALLAACAPANPVADAGAADVVSLPPVQDPPDNPRTEARVELGRQLFHDPFLSSDRQVACVTCHSQVWGMSDGLPQSIGVGGVGPAGTGRHGPTHTRRNAPSLWNVGYRAPLFWDGRSPTLEAQALGPLRNPVEMNRDPDALVLELRAMDAYRALFALAFPGEAEPFTVDNLTRALAAFERTLVSDRAPWDRWRAGDSLALSDSEQRGWGLFQVLRCDGCHTPPLFFRAGYEPTPVPPLADVVDHGRAEFTLEPADEGLFAIPGLRNVRDGAPYFHTGTVELLDDAVRLEARSRPGARALTDAEATDLVAFLHGGLTDRSREPAHVEVAPSGLPAPLDGYRVPR